jgi:subtilase family serine protease
VAAGAFTVRFLANGVPIGGDIAVGGIAEKGSVTVNSNIFTVSTAETDCPINITVVADAGSAISEGNESNNSETVPLGADIEPLHLPGEFGSASNPVRVRVNTSKLFNAYIRNMGSRDIHNVTVKFMHNGTKIGEALVPLIKAGKDFPAVASFTHTFTVPGPTTVDIVTDTANLVL